MKLYALVLSLLLCFILTAGAELNLIPLDGPKIRTTNLPLPCADRFYFFDDNTIVSLFTPPYEGRTWTEWWNDSSHQQPNNIFYFQLHQWDCSTAYQIYRYEQFSSSNRVYKYLSNHPRMNKEVQSKYPYLIENVETGQMTLCQVWTLDEFGSFVSRYQQRRFDEGFAAGAP